mgnify:FL=1
MSYLNYNKNNNETYRRLCLTYFKSRNIYNMGYMRYSIIKNLIRYITDIDDTNIIRYIFQSLYNEGSFKSKKIFNRIHYQFNPHDKIDLSDKGSIIFV